MKHGGPPPLEGKERPGLARKLGLIPVTLLGVGAIIGVGIYVIIGAASGRAGNAVWLSFLLSAIAAAFTGLTYARFGQLRPKNAPEYQYVDMAFGHLPGFLAEWLMLVMRIAVAQHIPT